MPLWKALTEPALPPGREVNFSCRQEPQKWGEGLNTSDDRELDGFWKQSPTPDEKCLSSILVYPHPMAVLEAIYTSSNKSVTAILHILKLVFHSFLQQFGEVP